MPVDQWRRFYSLHEFPTFPLNGKHPLPGTRGFHDAALDYDWPPGATNIGMRPPDGTVVIDVDPRNQGHHSLVRLVTEHQEWPETLTAATGGGGGHFWFAYSGPVNVAKIGAGIDVKTGKTGYVVAPPSVHPDTGRRYTWAVWRPIAPAPMWLRRMLTPPTPPRLPRDTSGISDGHGLLDFLAGAPTGNRNNALHWAACRVWQECADPESVAGRLIEIAVEIGLGRRAAEATVRSAKATP